VHPEYPIPPHWPHLDVVQPVGVLVLLVVLVVGLAAVEVDLAVEVGLALETLETGGLPPVVPPELKVEPMGPNFMFEKVTEAPGWAFSTVAATPAAGSQVPRATPGADGEAVGGYGASSQFMATEVSSQMDMTKTIPVSIDLPNCASPPLVSNTLVSPKAVFWASQKAGVMELPVTPAMSD